MSKCSSRDTYILNMLSTTGRITTSEAAEHLGISVATARRMFARLEQSGKIVRNYGGIQLAERSNAYSFEQREQVYRQEKTRIGRIAASFVENGDTIYLDCGTTVFQMTMALSARIASDELTTLNIVTNSIANVQAIVPSPTCHVILIGGEYNNQRRDFSGPLTEKYLAPFHFSKCFLGSDGVHEQMGFSSNQFDISSLNSAVLERSDKVFTLLDSSKFSRVSLLSYASLSDVDGIVTDRAPEGSLAASLEQNGVQVFLTDSPSS